MVYMSILFISIGGQQMKTEFEISEPHTAEGIWSLISDVITHDLSFPSLAIEHFSQNFTDKELFRRIQCSDGKLRS